MSQASPSSPSAAKPSVNESMGAQKLDRAVDSGSLDRLREAILRRIMRAACGVGALCMLISLLFVRPFNVLAGIVGAVATVAVYLATLLPARMRVVSTIYPWLSVSVGAALGGLMGPKAEPFLLAAGGLFTGSLVLAQRQHTIMLIVGSGLGVGAAASWLSLHGQATQTVWINAAIAMVAAVMPAAIAGRMLVTALDQALKQSESLVRRLVDESHAREQAIRALENAKIQLTHAQKMELIGQMAGGIAHDMNNALTAIMGEASLLEDGVKEERERIVESAAYAAKLTQQLMVFGRRNASQPRPLDLVKTIRGTLQSIRRILPGEISFESHVPNEPIAVVADPTQLLQILLNLAGNAKDAMPEGGRLTISVGQDPAAGIAAIEVRDTGSGIEPDVLPRIFEPFFTTKPTGQGTGLGLANVKQLVESMNGSIKVESLRGAGTRFVVTIPLTDANITVETKASKALGPHEGTILVVDDDVRVRAVAFTALERIGYRVFEAASPDAARAIAQAHRSELDLLVTDVVMGDGGGAAVIERVRQILPDIPVLVMSGYADDETLRRGIAQGAFPFLAKPFTADDLADAVDRTLHATAAPARGSSSGAR